MLDEELNFADPDKAINYKSLQHYIDVMDLHSTSIINKLIKNNKIRTYANVTYVDAHTIIHWREAKSTLYNVIDKNNKTIINWFNLLNAKRGWVIKIINLHKNPHERF